MMRRLSVRSRLQLALILLAVATLTVGAIAWVGLTRGAERLDRLHSGTLVQVDGALTLSRQAADLAAQAPYLLTLDSPFRIAKEGAQASVLVDAIIAGLPEGSYLHDQMRQTRHAIAEVVRETSVAADLRDRTLRVNAALAGAERRFADLSAHRDIPLDERQEWLALQRQVAALLGAVRAENLISVGEFHRLYLVLSRAVSRSGRHTASLENERLRSIAIGPGGLFELRRLELASQLRAEAALVRIREGAAAVTDYSMGATNAAQQTIAAERARATTAIGLAKTTILLVGLCSAGLALVAALYVSGYVTANLRAISDAMMRLASGDRQSRLPRGEGSGDEIGKLFHAFRHFRANALRLDRSSRQMARRTVLFDNMMDGISDGVAILSDQGAVLTANRRMAEVLRIDCSVLDGRPVLQRLVGDWGWSAKAGPGGIVELFLEPHHHAEMRESVLPEGQRVVLISDATERREMDERLRQIQRIEAIGKVSGEVAHDFGNILSTISASLHLMETARPERQAGLRQSVASAVDLGTSLTQRLLSFARRQQLAPETIELNGLVDGMGDLVGFALPDAVQLEIHTHPTPFWVRVDPAQMESAILNLCLNAGQAINGCGRVTVTVEARGSQAVLTVRDTGIGMSPDVLAYAMEPFYTARQDGTGTGLGLAMVYGFMRQSGGDVQITSTPGEGTSVCLTLPLQADPCPENRAPALPPLGSVLLVEDDTADMARAGALLVAAAGKLVTLGSAPEAADRIAQDCPDLLVTDLNLHGRIEGWRLAEMALSANPRVRAIVISGHLPQVDPLSHRFAGRIAAIAKPVSAESLARAILALTDDGVTADDHAPISVPVRL